MESDRELLELAARAAGIKVHVHEPTNSLWIDGPCVWSPLTDDGDALRLAVELKIRIDLRDPVTMVFGPVGERVDEYHKPDAFSATRRAIVRAAASIGKQMNADKAKG